MQIARCLVLLLVGVVGCLDGDPNPLAPSVEAGTAVASGACSIDGGASVQVIFQNTTDRPLALKWVNSACTEIDYGIIAGRQAHTQTTFANHVWRFRDASSGVVVREIRAPSTPTAFNVP